MQRNRSGRGRTQRTTQNASGVVSSGPVLVQTTGLKQVNASASGTETLTNAFPSNVTAGSFCVWAMTWYNTTIQTLPTSVTIGGSAATLATSQRSALSTNYYTAIYYVQSATGGTRDVVIVAPDTSGHYIGGSGEEYTGMAASALDQVPTPVVDASGTSRSITSGATTVARELVYAAACEATNFGSPDSFAGPTTGYTQTALANTVSNLGAAIGYKIVSATGAQSATFTNSIATEVCVVMATFKGT